MSMQQIRQPHVSGGQNLLANQASYQKQKSNAKNAVNEGYGAPLGAHQQISRNQPEVQGRQVKKRSSKKDNLPLQQDYLVNCKILEANLSKNLSGFFSSSVNVFCEIRFKSTSVTFSDVVQNQANVSQNSIETKISETAKNTTPASSQNPKWDNEVFSFNYEGLTKSGQRKYATIKNMKITEVIESIDQQLYFTLYKKQMLFQNDKIGHTTIKLHNSSQGSFSQTEWFVLTNEQDEVVGKLLAFIEIKKDIATKLSRQIYQDLQMHGQDEVKSKDSPDPGMNKDMTDERSMPLRGHQQVALLNERPEPQSNHQSNAPTVPLTQLTQVTHVTHQTQNSAIPLGGIGAFHASNRSPNQSSNATAPFKHRAPTQNSIFALGNQTVGNISNPTGYLDTTNIIPNNKLSKNTNQLMLEGEMEGCIDEAGLTGLQNQTVNHRDFDDEYYEEDADSEYQGGQLAIRRQKGPRGNPRSVLGLSQKAHHQIVNNSLGRYNTDQQNAMSVAASAEDQENSSMLMGMGLLQMGVVATQHIREEYDEEDDDELNDDDEEEEEYGNEQLEIDVEEESTHPVNEGGGQSQSTGVQDSNGNQNSNQNAQDSHAARNLVYHTNEPQQTVPAISQSRIKYAAQTSSKQIQQRHTKNNRIEAEEDDESNINSDEQNEYPEVSAHRYQNNQPYQPLPQKSQKYQNESLKRHPAIRPGTATGSTGGAYKREAVYRSQLHQSQSEMNIRDSEEGDESQHYQFQYLSQQTKMRGQAQQAAGGPAQTRSLMRGNNGVSRQNTHHHLQGASKNMLGKQTLRGPSTGNRQGAYGPAGQQTIQNQQIKINTIDVEPSFRQRQGNIFQSGKGINQSTNQVKQTDKILIRRGNRLPISTTPGALLGAHRQSHGLLLAPEGRAAKGHQLQQQQSVGYPRPASQTRHQQQRNHGHLPDEQGPSYVKGPSTRHKNFNTNPQNNYLASQQQSYFNSNVANTQVHTQEAQHNTNQTEGHGDYHLGEIDDEDLLLGHESYSSERRGRAQKSDSDDYVNSEGDPENYQKESPVPRKRGVLPRSQKKLRQPSHGRGIMEDRGFLGGEQNLYDHHHHTTVGLTGGVPSGSIGTNPLEHETFSMGQQDTFQVDPNGRKAQQTVGSKHANNGQSEWARRVQPVLRPYTSHSGFGRDLNQRALARSQKNDLVNQRVLHPNASVIASDHQAGANGHVDHSVIQHITSHSGSPSSEEIPDNQNHYDMMQNQMYPGGTHLSQSQKKSGNRRKQHLKQQEGGKRKQAQNQYAAYAKQSDSIHIGGGTVVGCSEDQRRQVEGSSSEAREERGALSGSIVEEHNNQTLMQQLNSYQEYKDSAIMPHPPHIEQNHDHQRYSKMGEQSAQKAVASSKAQVGPASRKQFRGERASAGTNEPVIHAQRPHQKRVANSGGVAHLGPRQHGVHHPSAGTLGVESELGSQLPGCGIGTLDGGQSLDQVDIFSQLNNRALSHEMQLNQIHRDLKQQNHRIKLEKQALRELKEKTKREAKALEAKQNEYKLQSSQLQKAQYQLNQDKILVKNEIKKVQKLHQKFSGMIDQHFMTNRVNLQSSEINEQLSSISVLLQLLLNDRTLKNEDDDDKDVKSISQQKENLSKSVEQEQQISSSDQLQQMCGMYQNKLDEMSRAFANIQNMQNLQIMSNKMMELQNQMQQAHAFAPSGLGFTSGIHPLGAGAQQNYQIDSSQTVTPISHLNFAPMMQSALQANSNLASQGATTPIHDQSQIMTGQALNGHLYTNQSQIYDPNQISSHFNQTNQQNYAAQLDSQHQDKVSSLIHEAINSIEHNQNMQDLPHSSLEQPQTQNEDRVDKLQSATSSPQPPIIDDAKLNTAQEHPKSSSSSEFVFNPDPNFLANINRNIKINNAKFANQENQFEQVNQEEQKSCQNEIEDNQGERDSRHRGRELSAILSDPDDGDDYSQTKGQGGEWTQQEQDCVAQRESYSQDGKSVEVQEVQNQQIVSTQQPAILEDEREALISDCGSDIQIEEADQDDLNGQSQIEETKEQALQTQSSQALVQGTQGDFQIPNNAQSQSQTLSQSSQMSVFNQFQRELQKIGRPNQYPSAVNHEEVKISIDEVVSPLVEDIELSNYHSQAPARKDINEFEIDAQKSSTDLLKVCKDEELAPQKSALTDKGPKSERAAVSEKENEFSEEDSDEDEMEQSVVYSTNGQHIYDQPHRAVYGIKPVKDNF